MFTRPLNRGCYQPRSRCMFSFTCAWIQFRIDTYAHTRTKSLFSNSLTHTHTRPRPPPSGPVEGHAFVSRCQDAGVCSCASRSIRFILFSRGCPFVCGPVSFQPTPISPPRGRQCVCCITGRGVVTQTPPSHHHHHHPPTSRCYHRVPAQPLRLDQSDLVLESP